MEVKVTNGNDDNRPKLEVEEIKKRILADDRLTNIALLPLYYNMTNDIDYDKITYLFYVSMIDDFTAKPTLREQLKAKLEAEINEPYLYRLSQTYAIMEKVTAIALLTGVIYSLYEINLIQDNKIKTFKIKQLKLFIEHIDLQKIIDDILFTIGNQGFLINLNAKAYTDDLKTDFNNIAFMEHLTIKYKDFLNYLLQEDDTSTAKYIALNRTSFTDIFMINKYTEYNLLTQDGIENYIKRHDSVENKIKELEEYIHEARILTKDGVKIREHSKIVKYKDFINLIAYDDEERDILTRNKEEELAGLESASTPIKPNSMTYTTNKIHQNLSKIETLTEINDDILPISLSKKKGDIVAIASMETMQDAIYKLNLTPFDELILDACKNLFKLNKEINTESVCDYITGNTGTRPNKAMLEDIEKSILTLSGKILRLEYATPKHLKGKQKGEEIELHFTAPLLPIKAVKVKYKGHEKTFYRLVGTYEENDYFKFTDALGQLASTKTLYLKASDKVRINKENTLINNYLAKQITLIKRGSLDTNKISYDKIYSLCGIDTSQELTDPKEQRKYYDRTNRIRANVSYLLKEKQKLGFIKGYKEYKEEQGTAHRVAGIEIFTEDDTKTK